MIEDVLGLMIPILAIVMGIGTAMLKMFFRHQEEMAAIRGSKQQVLGPDALSEIDQLKDEIARLRDTTTQYDLSIDHYLKDLDQRLKSVENRETAYVHPVRREPEQQIVVPRNSG